LKASVSKAYSHTHTHDALLTPRFTHVTGLAHRALPDATVWMVPRDKTEHPAREELLVSRVLPDPRDLRAGRAPQDLREPAELPETPVLPACPVRVAPLEGR
jgi:hypothetical protein